MMGDKIVLLKAQKITYEILCGLEKEGLVKMLRPTFSIERNTQKDCVESVYASNPVNGGHTLLCVRKNVTDITLTSHEDNEDVIFIKPPSFIFKPLYLILSTLKREAFNEKVEQGCLSEKDFLALEIEYNSPLVSIFTIVKDVVHCEVTIDGTVDAPIFYVTEPSQMKMHVYPCPGMSFSINSN